jgi:hypothetical protein
MGTHGPHLSPPTRCRRAARSPPTATGSAAAPPPCMPAAGAAAAAAASAPCSSPASSLAWPRLHTPSPTAATTRWICPCTRDAPPSRRARRRHWQARRMPMADADRSSSVCRQRAMGTQAGQHHGDRSYACTDPDDEHDPLELARAPHQNSPNKWCASLEAPALHATQHDASECPLTPVDAEGAGRTAVRPTAQRFSAPRKSALPLHRTSPHHASHTQAETGP